MIRIDGDFRDALVFTQVVEHRSFARAADALGLPSSAVSRRVARLENALGGRLLQRTTRRLALTDLGSVYFEHASRAMDELHSGEAAVRALQAEPRGTVRLTTARGPSAAVFAAARDYLQANPEVSIEVDVSEGFADLVEGRLDLAIRAGVLPDSSLIGRKLSSADGQLFASPQYLESAPALQSIADLVHHQCVVIGSSFSGAAWTLYEGRRARSVGITGRVAVADLHLAIDAAVAGFGIVRAPKQMVEQLVDDGSLVRVLAPVHAGEGAVWLVYAQRQLTAAVRGLAEYLVAALPDQLNQLT